MAIPTEHIEHFQTWTREEQALELARQAVEVTLLSWRNSRMSHLDAGNGFVIREHDGSESSNIRLRTRDGLRIGIEQYNKVMAGDEDFALSEMYRLDGEYDKVEAERLETEGESPAATFIVNGG